jgi:TPR repeat protein
MRHQTFFLRSALAIFALIAAPGAAQTGTSSAGREAAAACDEAYLKEAFQDALPLCRQAAAAGDPTSIFNYARILERLADDTERALDLYRRAARLGSVSAQTMLGIRLVEAGSNQGQIAEGERLVQRAAAGGGHYARYVLASLYERGTLPSPGISEVKQHLEATFEHGGIDQAAEQLASLHRGTATGLQDLWLWRAARRGLYSEYLAQGLRRRELTVFAYGSPQRYSDFWFLNRISELLAFHRPENDRISILARERRRRASAIRAMPAEIRDEMRWLGIPAQPVFLPLGHFIETQNGPFDSAELNERLAVLAATLRAAQRPDGPAFSSDRQRKPWITEYQYRIAELYRNHSESAGHSAGAARWYGKAADSGHTEALFWLGHAHETGTGASQDLEEAIDLYRRSVETADSSLDYQRAAFRLARLFSDDDRAPEDIEFAAAMALRASGLYCQDEEQASSCLDDRQDAFTGALFLASGLFGDEIAKLGKDWIVAKDGETLRDERLFASDFNEVVQGWIADLSSVIRYQRQNGRQAPERAFRTLGPIGHSDIASVETVFDASAWEEWIRQEAVNNPVRPDLSQNSAGVRAVHISQQPLQPLRSGNIAGHLPLVIHRVVFPQSADGRNHQQRIASEANTLQRVIQAEERHLQQCGIALDVEAFTIIEADPTADFWATLTRAWPTRMPKSDAPALVLLDRRGKISATLPDTVTGQALRIDHTRLFGSKDPAFVFEMDDASPATIAHELGHVLGLGHPVHFRPTIMSYFFSPGRSGPVPNMWPPPRSFTDEECARMLSSPLIQRVVR